MVAAAATANVLEIARPYVAAELSVVPIKADGKKRPDGSVLPHVLGDDGLYHASWKPFQERQPTDEELVRWFGPGQPPRGLAILGGAVSGGLEIIDFDRDEAFDAWFALAREENWSLLLRLCVVKTHRGYHVYYRCPGHIKGNQKLAQRTDAQGQPYAIETRGEGGYVLAPGCPPACHPDLGVYRHVQGPPVAAVATIDPSERGLLLGLAQLLSDPLPPAQPWDGGGRMPPAAGTPGGPGSPGERPGNRWEREATWEEVLCPRGWVRVGTCSGLALWRRPGKNHGWSATTGLRSDCGRDLLYVFTSSAPPPEQGRSYSKFAALATLQHGGDYRAAVRALAERYGLPRRPGAGGNGNGKHRPAPSPPCSTRLGGDRSRCTPCPRQSAPTWRSLRPPSVVTRPW
jgi:putative DNA primase/helicase